MNIKEWLKEMKELSTEIYRKRIKILNMWSSATYSSVGFEERVQSTRNLHKHSDTICDIIDKEREVKDLEKELKKRQTLLIEKTKLLNNDMQANIIIKRYIENKEWLVISDELGISKRWALEQHRNALKKLSILMHFTY